MICAKCGLFHSGDNCVEVATHALKLLVSAAGIPGECKGCGQQIFWVRHMNGKTVPYAGTGQNHFIDCPKAKDFKR